MRQHVIIDVAFDDLLAGTILLDPAHPRFRRRVAYDPRDRNVPDVLLHDLLGLRIVRESLLWITRVAAGFELLVERVVRPRLALAGRLLAVERVEVLVVRIRIIHEPPDPHELQILLPEP